VLSQDMDDSYIGEFPNSRNNSGELFFNLPIGIGKFVDIVV